jgi:hypothetical protein
LKIQKQGDGSSRSRGTVLLLLRVPLLEGKKEAREPSPCSLAPPLSVKL